MDEKVDNKTNQAMDQAMDKNITQKVVERISLENGQTLFIKDLSRRIGADAFQVVMEATVEIAVKPDLFSPQTLGDVTFEVVHKKVGDCVTFKHRAERNFIMADERKAVFEKFVDTFRINIVPYLSKPVFPAKFVMKTFRD